MASANALANSVLPTPVGPKNINEPIGRFGSFKPLRARRIARETAEMASSWPTTRLCKTFSSCMRRSLSLRCNWVTGTPVHCATTWAMSSAVTWMSLRTPFSCSAACNLAILALVVTSCSWIVAAFSKSCARTAASLSSFKVCSFCSNLSNGVFWLTASKRTLAVASSIKSIALSGKNRFVM